MRKLVLPLVTVALIATSCVKRETPSVSETNGAAGEAVVKGYVYANSDYSNDDYNNDDIVKDAQAGVTVVAKYNASDVYEGSDSSEKVTLTTVTDSLGVYTFNIPATSKAVPVEISVVTGEITMKDAVGTEFIGRITSGNDSLRVIEEEENASDVTVNKGGTYSVADINLVVEPMTKDKDKFVKKLYYYSGNIASYEADFSNDLIEMKSVEGVKVTIQHQDIFDSNPNNLITKETTTDADGKYYFFIPSNNWSENYDGDYDVERTIIEAYSFTYIDSEGNTQTVNIDKSIF